VSRLSPLASVVPAFVVLVCSLSFHEAAHAWTADRLGDTTARRLGRLTLNPLMHIDWIGTVLFPLLAFYSGVPLIGWAKPVPVNPHNLVSPRRDIALVAIAGPVSNLLLAVGAAALLLLMPHDASESSATVAAILTLAVELNVLLAVFNLIPVPPLDGGNVLAGFVPETVARGIDRLRPFGIVILYLLMFSGVLSLIAGPIEQTVVGWLVR
jgi:Zn-dependent protease